MSLYKHICEVCQREEILTSDEAFEAGWDYPPRMGAFGVLSPRTCPDCLVSASLWWRLSQGDRTFTEKDEELILRVVNEPASILVAEE